MLEEGDRIGGVFRIIDGQVDEPRAAINCHIKEALSYVAVCGAQPGQMFDVNMDKAQIIVPEAPLSLAGLHRRLRWSSIEALRLENPINAVAVKMRQEVPEHEGEIIQRKTCRPAHCTDDRALFFAHTPSKALGSA